MLKDYQEYANNNGMEINEFISNEDSVANVKELLKKRQEDLLQKAKFYLVCQAIAENAGLSVSQEDIAKYLQYEEGYGLPFIKQVVLLEKVMDHITEKAVLA